jgi:two-component system nitrogen regulation response regulator GlnG
MPAETQTRLLRVLADGEFYRVGGHTPINVDVRIIAATHQDLETLVNEKKFREDLFHRLNVIRIHIPKLSNRQEDIPKLTQYFFKKAASDLEVEPKILLPETEDYLRTLPWPGNVRQLENTCRWITVMGSGREVHISDLPPEIQAHDNTQVTLVAGDWENHLQHWANILLKNGEKNILQSAVPTFEKTLIKAALHHTSGRKRDAAELLGWGRNTLTRKLKELELSSEDDN